MAEGRFVVSRIGRNLVVTLEGASDVDTLREAASTMAEMHAREGAGGAVVEVSGCEVIDLEEFTELRKLVETLQWLGLRCVIAGLRPGIVAYLASAGVALGSLQTSLDLELALSDLDQAEEPEPDPEPEADSGDDDDEDHAWPL